MTSSLQHLEDHIISLPAMLLLTFYALSTIYGCLPALPGVEGYV